MWSDSEDLAVISDMFQLNIKVITLKGEFDSNPTINWIYPDKSMKKHANLSNVELGEMVLLHRKDHHFDLIVSNHSDLVTNCSLSHMHKVEMTDHGDAKEDSRDDDIIMTEVDSNNTEEDIVAKLKAELKLCQKEKDKIYQQYNLCEKALRSKTEEVAKLERELRDINQVNMLREKNVVDTLEDSVKLLAVSQGKTNVVCEESFSFMKCDFQGTSQLELNKHTNIKHCLENIHHTIKCYHCDSQFSSKWNLMEHRKSNHAATVAICRNFKKGACSYADVKCWWRHTTDTVVTTESAGIKCFVCEKVFNTKEELMLHRKKDHAEMVKKCTKYETNICKFRNEACWFVHSESAVEHKGVEKDNENKIEQSVFQIVTANPKPPFQNKA